MSATRHDAAISYTSKSGPFRAGCVCGWITKPFPEEADAVRAAWCHERDALLEQVKELEATRCQEDHLHPDWSMLDATRRSLRDGWVREKRLHAVLEREAMNLSGDRSWCTLCRTESFDRKAPHHHHPSCALVYVPEEPQPTPERLMLVEIANHLSLRLAWGIDPGTVDVEWIKRAIDERSERTHKACIVAAGKKDSEAALAVECDVDPLAP